MNCLLLTHDRYANCDLETVGDSPGPKMYLHTKYGTAAINNIGDLLWVHFFQELTPEIKVTVAENSERHSMTPTLYPEIQTEG